MVRVDAAMRGWQAKLCACVASGWRRPAGGAACPQSRPWPGGANLPRWRRPPGPSPATGADWGGPAAQPAAGGGLQCCGGGRRRRRWTRGLTLSAWWN